MVTEESNSGLDWETEESWWRTPAAIGFIIGVALGFIVLLVFLGAVGRNPGNLGIPKSRNPEISHLFPGISSMCLEF